jgi:hypothetical protein
MALRATGGGEDTENPTENEMTLAIADTDPDFETLTTEGPIRAHDWIWGLVRSADLAS